MQKVQPLCLLAMDIDIRMCHVVTGFVPHLALSSRVPEMQACLRLKAVAPNVPDVLSYMVGRRTKGCDSVKGKALLPTSHLRNCDSQTNWTDGVRHWMSDEVSKLIPASLASTVYESSVLRYGHPSPGSWEFYLFLSSLKTPFPMTCAVVPFSLHSGICSCCIFTLYVSAFVQSFPFVDPP